MNIQLISYGELKPELQVEVLEYEYKKDWWYPVANDDLHEVYTYLRDEMTEKLCMDSLALDNDGYNNYKVMDGVWRFNDAVFSSDLINPDNKYWFIQDLMRAGWISFRQHVDNGDIEFSMEDFDNLSPTDEVGCGQMAYARMVDIRDHALTLIEDFTAHLRNIVSDEVYNIEKAIRKAEEDMYSKEYLHDLLINNEYEYSVYEQDGVQYVTEHTQIASIKL